METNFEVIFKNDKLIKIVNVKTGEVEAIPVIDFEKNEVISREKIEAIKRYYFRIESRLRDTRGDFVFANADKETETVLSLSQRALIMFLMLYADYEKPLNINGDPLTYHSIAKLWKIYKKEGKKEQITAKKMNEKLNELVKIGVLEKVSKEDNKKIIYYKFNRCHLFMGPKKHNEKYIKIYKKKLKEVIKELEKIEKRKNQNRKNAKINVIPVIGLLHAIVPYVHPETGYLVKNPEIKLDIQEGESVFAAIKRNPTLLKGLTKAAISRSLGYDNMNRDTVKTYLQILADAGALKIDDTYGKKMYLVHPELIYAKDTGAKEHFEDLQGMFNLHKHQEEKDL